MDVRDDLGRDDERDRVDQDANDGIEHECASGTTMDLLMMAEPKRPYTARGQPIRIGERLDARCLHFRPTAPRARGRLLR